ncbi:MAG: HypC/HybG/HupF family hydrogenase formation chaperone [Alphaproteobacteria bacterium]|nr:HypC/HybG/HupF family hydrogenase formation chaperone [Alphaproteobacteria bacterium]
MCIAIPAEVLSITWPTATVDIYGERLTVSLMTLSEDIEPGDFVALQGGRHAVARMSREEALEARRLLEEVFPDLASSPRNKAEGRPQ